MFLEYPGLEVDVYVYHDVDDDDRQEDEIARDPAQS